MATYEFGAIGLTGLAEGTYGLLQSFELQETGDEEVARDNKGNVAAQEIYNTTENITCEYVFDSSTSPPERGDSVNLDTDKYYSVMEVSKTEQNQGYKRVSLTLKRYVSNIVPAS